MNPSSHFGVKAVQGGARHLNAIGILALQEHGKPAGGFRQDGLRHRLFSGDDALLDLAAHCHQHHQNLPPAGGDQLDVLEAPQLGMRSSD